MSEPSLFHGPNAGYVLELFDRYQRDPEAVDPQTRAIFAHWTPDTSTASPAATNGATPHPTPAAASFSSPSEVRRIVAVARLARYVREIGHLEARLDPLGTPPPGDADLELAAHGITARDLETLPPSIVGGPLAEGAANALEAMGRLRRAYSGTVGYETDHIQVASERDWLYNAIESGRFFKGFDNDRKRDLLRRLTEVDSFEQYLDRSTNKAKRFSIEGTDMLVPMLDEIIHDAMAYGTKEAVIGMAHRGRLNVLTHIMGKPYADVLSGFETAGKGTEMTSPQIVNNGWTGDVKYHLGYHKVHKNGNGTELSLTLVPNPSHLEFVNPVAEGRVRAAQDNRVERGPARQDVRAGLAILIHGDAAFPGQGIVAETLNLERLPGYNTGGTIHIIVNNQIGFTTLPADSRSTIYAGDLAKGFEIPIVHVNADDPIACLAVTRMAHAYREQFNKDFLIDLIGYRRYGHNESDEPAFTQPKMYEAIRAYPRLREQWAKRLEQEGVVTRDEAEALVREIEGLLKTARNAPVVAPKPYDDMENASRSGRSDVPTAVPADQLIALNEALLVRTEGFVASEKLEKGVFQRRRVGLQNPGGIDWGHAETLAFASILADGTPIRLTGQDSERGTFGQRNAVIHDPLTGERFCPLQNIPQARAAFAIYNSPLSENACLGFEYGYSMHAPDVLTLWEGQYGDFANGAQVIIDQFLVSGNAKWRQTPSLVMLLPHGYEGSGPEHSSARLERFLQLAATDNIRVVNCTTSAQYFHLLRRQAALLERDPRPLIVMAPKSLLREPLASSSLSDLAEGKFLPLIDDAAASERADEVTRLILSSGKVYIDLIKQPDFADAKRIAAVRLEEIYPFPTDELRAILAGYPNLRELVWLQEEPCNMGAWMFVRPRLRDPEMVGWKGELTYIGRAEAASPAEGSGLRHKIEQERILTAALKDVPEWSGKKPSGGQVLKTPAAK